MFEIISGIVGAWFIITVVLPFLLSFIYGLFCLVGGTIVSFFKFFEVAPTKNINNEESIGSMTVRCDKQFDDIQFKAGEFYEKYKWE